MAEFYNSLYPDTDKDADSSADLSTGALIERHTNGIRECGTPVLLDENEKGLGFWGNLYCPYCGGRCDFILVDFECPASSPKTEISMREWGEDLLKCPKCGYPAMELLRD